MTVDEYHRELVRRLSAILGGRLLGVYAGGSFGLGDFDAERSDLDVFAVCRGGVAPEDKAAIVAALRHESLPCPARGLEFVLYPEPTARTPSADAGFALNLNTGPRIAFRVDEEPGAVERHWFPLDRAIVRAAGATLLGPPPERLFAPIPRPLLLPVVREALEWHLAPGRSGDDDTVLNACRALRWLREDVWSSKSDAGEWALARVVDAELVTAALASRDRSARLGTERVAGLVGRVLAELDRESSSPAEPRDAPVTLVEYRAEWPALYAREEARLRAALGGRALVVEHVGSTAVPGLAAKPRIDVLLVVADSADEGSYVPALEGAGYLFRIREPEWHEHRLLRGPDTAVNVHVFSNGSPEAERMLRFRDRLRADEADRRLYERTKRELARRRWRTVQDYADAKSTVVEAILARAGSKPPHRSF